jgi:hypothetical protein
VEPARGRWTSEPSPATLKARACDSSVV